MKEYLNSTLLYTVYIFAATGITMLAGGGVSLILIFVFSGAAEPGNFVSGLINTVPVLLYIALPFAVLCIAMHRIGYKRNTTYEEKPDVKKLLIPVTISSLIFIMLNTATGFRLTNSFDTAMVHLFNIDVSGMNAGEFYGKYLFENHSSLLMVSVFLQITLYTSFMVLGFYMGYKKRKKDRKEITGNKNN